MIIQQISNTYDRAMKVLFDIASFFSILILISIFGVMTAEVVTRQFLNVSLAWVVDFAQFGIVWMVFIGGSCLVYLEKHIAVEFFHKFINPKALVVLQIVFDLVVLYILYVLIRYGYQNAVMGRGRMSASYLTDMYYPRLGIPIGSALMFLQTINNFLKRVSHLVTKDKTLEELGKEILEKESKIPPKKSDKPEQEQK